VNTTVGTEKLTPRAKRLFTRAYDKAMTLDIDAIGVEHLLFAMLDDPDSVAFHALARYVDVDTLRRDLTAIFESEGYLTGSTRVVDRDGNVIGDTREGGWTVVEE